MTTDDAHGDDFEATGHCACGAVSYAMTARPLFVHCCHCHWCQRETGSAFAVNALVETTALAVTGPAERIETPSESGNGQAIHRCPTCRVALWSQYGGMGEAIAFVRVGTLDDPDQCPPDIHIYTDSKRAWVTLPDDKPVLPEYYRRSRYWPDESVARLKAARGR